MKMIIVLTVAMCLMTSTLAAPVDPITVQAALHYGLTAKALALKALLLREYLKPKAAPVAPRSSYAAPAAPRSSYAAPRSTYAAPVAPEPQYAAPQF